MEHIAKLSIMDENGDSPKVIEQIIQANPLLECFGNAKTTRNDNSSRFGKFTELQFSNMGMLIGAKSKTYLLEKSRVTKQNKGERNFHVFYQLLAVAGEKYKSLQLNYDTEYHYVQRDNTITKEKMSTFFNHTLKALEIIGISNELQSAMLNVLAAVLHLGQVMFAPCNGDVDSSELVNTKQLDIVADLLQVPSDMLDISLCNRNVRVGQETYLKPYTVDQSMDTRDALAKALYAKLFSWLVVQINDAISAPDSKISNTIGLLDIFGFELFEHNSFEQLCINYANEKLQQKFVQDVLKTVQQEYEEEGISWDHVTFADNQDVLDIIEGRLGVFSLLNEESILATGSDKAFAHKLASVLEGNNLISTPKLNNAAFTICHYAGQVTYDTIGFLDKHRDALRDDINDVMSGSNCAMVSKLFPPTVVNTRKKQPQGKKNNLSTVGMQFKVSLASLMDTIGQTEVHYVRCIKPNSKKSPIFFDHKSVVNQLRCAGVIEAIRVSRSAYPVRMSQVDCIHNFGVLLSASNKNLTGDLKDVCLQMLSALVPEADIEEYQVGATKVYFRQGMLEVLESRRAEALKDRAILMQKTIKGFLYRTRYSRMRTSAVHIQKVYRSYVAKKKYLTLMAGVRRLQAQQRGIAARKMAKDLELFRDVTTIQAAYRGYQQRSKYKHYRRNAIKIQAASRMMMARNRYALRLSKERRNKALGSKVALLQTKLDSRSKRNVHDIPERPSTVLRASQVHNSGIFNESAELLAELQEENRRIRDELELLTDSNTKLKERNRTLQASLSSKQLDEKVKTIAQHDQEAKDSLFYAAVAKEYDTIRLFVCDLYGLSTELGSIPNSSTEDPDIDSTSSIPADRNLDEPRLSDIVSGEFNLATGTTDDARTKSAQTMLTRCGNRLLRAKNKTLKGSSRRVKDYWEEINTFPEPLEYTIGSVPWKRLLSDWAQGNPKKLDYMVKWLKNILHGGPIENSPFPLGVELKSVSPMMLDGFMQLVIPTLNKRQDVNVHVHTKEFIGTSMRITLSVNHSVPPMTPIPDPDPRAFENRATDILRRSGATRTFDTNDQWGRDSIRSVRN